MVPIETDGTLDEDPNLTNVGVVPGEVPQDGPHLFGCAGLFELVELCLRVGVVIPKRPDDLVFLGRSVERRTQTSSRSSAFHWGMMRVPSSPGSDSELMSDSLSMRLCGTHTRTSPSVT